MLARNVEQAAGILEKEVMMVADIGVEIGLAGMHHHLTEQPCLDELVQAPSRSRIRYLSARSQGNASVTCRAIHSAVGAVGTFGGPIRLRSIRTMTSAKSIRSSAVGTTKRSSAAMPLAWLRRKVFQLCDGGRRRLAMYLATVVCPRSKPSFSSSPWI